MCDWRERQKIEGGREIMEGGVQGVVYVELRQMSAIDEAWSNTDTQLGCNNKTSSSLQQSFVLTM